MDKRKLESWLNISESINIQMPNEIFDDFGQAEFNSFNHKCFAYAYYYLISHIYRNTLYGGSNTEQYSQNNIIKALTGNKTVVSYITKNDGLLDTIGYTRSTTNYPVIPYMDNDILEFRFIKDMRKQMSDSKPTHSPRFTIKEPVKALVRFDNEDFTGTFYSFQSTHLISVQRFINIITDSDLGHVGLFIYGYLKMMCDRYSNGFQISNTELGEVVGCSDRTIQKYTQRLEVLNLIESTRKLKGNRLYEKIYASK